MSIFFDVVFRNYLIWFFISLSIIVINQQPYVLFAPYRCVFLQKPYLEYVKIESNPTSVRLY